LVFEFFVIYLILFVFFKGAASGAVAEIALLRRFPVVSLFSPRHGF
jgi:hypothetical protein